MVVFTCGHCGESVQKPKVEKHYLTKCRNRNPNLSCMDCFKDFIGKDYEAHTKCVTEEERYAGKGFVAKEKKGELKQNTWVEMVQSVLDEQETAPKNILRIIEEISKHNNTPRKKPKFINFVKNVCGHKTNLKDIEGAWELISVKLSQLSVPNKKIQNEEAVPDGSTELKLSSPSKDDSNSGVVNEDNKKKENEVIENLSNGTAAGSDVIKTKKQRKQEKKNKKYEAELQRATIQPSEEIEEEKLSKKDKKKKNKSKQLDTEEHDEKGNIETNSKSEKKRKRTDTVNTVEGNVIEDTVEPVTIETVTTEKTKKKKLKTQEYDKENDNECLHDQNVAKVEELTIHNDKFNWHAVILSVVQKKGNEIQFKRLQKKVLAEYSETTGQDVDDRIANKFIKKLKSLPNVRVDKSKVYFIED